MFRPTFLVLIGVSLAAASCRSSSSEESRIEAGGGSQIFRDLKDYKVIESAHRGRVGYLKVYDVREGRGGNPYPWSYVYDTDWKELGWIDQFGGAFAYHFYSPAEQAQQNLSLRGTKMPADSLENNVMRMLGIDVSTDHLAFPEATKADIVGEVAAPHLGGPGVTPQPAMEHPSKP